MDEYKDVPCPVCAHTENPGFVVTNPEWPSGTEPYRKICPECGGDCVIPENELPATA